MSTTNYNDSMANGLIVPSSFVKQGLGPVMIEAKQNEMVALTQIKTGRHMGWFEWCDMFDTDFNDTLFHEVPKVGEVISGWEEAVVAGTPTRCKWSEGGNLGEMVLDILLGSQSATASMHTYVPIVDLVNSFTTVRHTQEAEQARLPFASQGRP